MKQITRITLDGKAIFSKPLLMNDTLTSIREKLNDRIKQDYLFLDIDGNEIVKQDESEFTLKDITAEKQIKLKSQEDNNSGIKIFLDEKMAGSINIEEKNNLDECRNIIKQKIKEEFTFLDLDGNPVEINDEKEFQLTDILKNNSIKLKKAITDFPPASLEQIETTPKPIYKRPKIFNKKNIDFSKYDIIKKETNITYYRYSKEKGMKTENELVYQYNFDKFEGFDENIAYVVLFVGKTGDGKTTAINAFFNIIKGIQLEDPYRFILIEEVEKEKGQAESQTDGVHIYHLKDYNDKPIILIDSQGYGDTRGKTYDEKLNEAFTYVFTNVIDHINTVCFLAKSNTNRLDILTKYIFSSVTSLFSEDISENFIILSTFAGKDTITEGPAFIKSLKTEDDFLNIQKRMNEKWWYAFDSKCILDNDTDRLSKYSFSQIKELYEEKVKKLRPKSIKKCAEVLKTRNELKIQVNLLNHIFENLLIEQTNLKEKNKSVEKILNKISQMEEKIRDFEEKSKKLNPKEVEEKIQKLNKELNDRIDNLNNETEEIIKKDLEYDENNIYTHCQDCKENCHDPCDCYQIKNYKMLSLCKILPWSIQNQGCKKCGCPVKSHKVDNYHYVTNRVNEKKNNEDLIKEEKEKNEKKRNELKTKLTLKKNEKNTLISHLEELNNNKSKLLDEKSKNLDERNEIEKKINNITHQIIFILIKLQNITEKISFIAMNINYIQREDEYIDFLKQKMDNIGIKDEEQEKNLDDIKRMNNTLLEVNKLKKEDLLNLSDSELSEKLGIIIPVYKR